MSTNHDKELGRDPTAWVVICVMAIILTAFFAIVIYLIYKDINAPQVTFRCNPGLCKTNVSTGFKSCPSPGDTIGIQVTPGAELCQSGDWCNNPKAPCAVLNDQTLSCNGVCDPGVACRCVAR